MKWNGCLDDFFTSDVNIQDQNQSSNKETNLVRDFPDTRLICWSFYTLSLARLFSILQSENVLYVIRRDR